MPLKKLLFFLPLLFTLSNSYAQNVFAEDDTIAKQKVEEPKITYPKFKVGGVFQARYLYSKKTT